MSKIDLAYTRGAERWNGLRLLRFAERALLSALQEPRERAARNMIRDHRHLLQQQGGAKESQEFLKGLSRESQEK